jgi:hypothetical protein
MTKTLYFSWAREARAALEAFMADSNVLTQTSQLERACTPWADVAELTARLWNQHFANSPLRCAIRGVTL